ncbi:hypothetical protein M9194_06045 [Vibrio sp. S4M6]|uniref:hypothetical protein n=1 Tax=Vibrio sinus TaxID=2946865 RepID=UPI00202A3AC0|nr:hypothetical protein [Vibrio sinus]MCL9780992.1 hypothetical protein [Vibrio sinus]
MYNSIGLMKLLAKSIVGLLLSSMVSIAAADSNGNVESKTKLSCGMGGCTMVCVSNKGKRDVKARRIESAELITYKSGMVRHNLTIGFSKVIVTSSLSMESCSFNNIEKMEEL